MSKKVLLGVILLVITTRCLAQIPEGFVNITDIDATIRVELRYFTTNNFVGRKIRGYKGNTAYLTISAAKALQMAHREAEKVGLGVLIYDAYRPQQAVDYFGEWSKIPGDTLKKNYFYPNIKKAQLFNQGFIASKSGHSRGSTVDITLYSLESGDPIDMGSRYDLFSSKSFHNSGLVKAPQLTNRNLLRSIMQNAGFKAYTKEWWHYTLIDEPFPNQYFNFEVK